MSSGASTSTSSSIDKEDGDVDNGSSGELHTHAASTVIDDATRECLAIQRDHNVIIGRNWGSTPVHKQHRWAALDCDNKIHQHNIHNAPIGPACPARSSSEPEPVIAVFIVSTSRNVNPLPDSLEHWLLFTDLFPSFTRSVDCGFRYIIYFGYDAEDRLYDRPDTQAELERLFDKTVRQPLANRRITVKLRSIRVVFPDPNFAGPVHANIMLAKKALAEPDPADQFTFAYRINDDTVFSDAGWAAAFTKQLLEWGSPYGAVGPRCDSGNTGILTHDMVHRQHFDIFDAYYPTEFKNWYNDDWVTQVYGRQRSRRFAAISVGHTLKHGTRYETYRSVEGQYRDIVSRDHKKIAEWMRAKGMPEEKVSSFLSDDLFFSVAGDQ